MATTKLLIFFDFFVVVVILPKFNEYIKEFLLNLLAGFDQKCKRNNLEFRSGSIFLANNQFNFTNILRKKHPTYK